MNPTDKFERFSGNEILIQNLKKKSVRAALYMATGRFTDFLLRIMSTVILARLLMPEDFGLVAMVAAVVGMAEVAKDLGLAVATVQSNNINHEQVTNLFWINVAAGVFFFIFFCLISIPIAKFYSEPRLVPITIALSTTFIWGGLQAQHEALLSRQLKQGRLSLIRLSANFLSLIAAILLVFGHYTYWALVWREVSRNLIIACGIWLSCPWVPGLPCRNTEIRRLLRFGRDMSVTQFIIGVIAKIDGLVIGKFFGSMSLGLYRQAYQLIMLPIEQLNGPVLSVAQPGLSRLQSEPDRYRRYYIKILLFLGITTIPIGIFVAVYAKELILLLLGDKWIDSEPFLRLLAIAAAIKPSVGTIAIVLITCGKSTKFLIVCVVQSMVFVLFIFIGIWWKGAVGVAIAHLATAIVLFYPKLLYSFAQTPISIKLFFKTLISPMISSIVMMAVLIFIRKCIPINAAFQSVCLGGFIGLLTYTAILLMLPYGRRDVNSLFRDVMSSIDFKSIFGTKVGKAVA